MKIVLFDTETTGLIKPAPAGLDKQPYIIEIYACAIDEDFQLLGEYETYIKPPYKYDDKITKITGIEYESLLNEPTFAEVYPDLALLFTGADLMVAHNLPFDRNMLANELLRIEKLIKFPWPRHHLCTVEASFNIRGYRLKLMDLHQEMLGRGFQNAHRAKNDVHALVRCFHAMVEKGMVDLEKYKQ